ncbi:glycoside hydrolase family 15 protein [Actinomadura latina]|uniref:Glycoside hydrolase family 15 protein n=1 Tax=Actinomadura latina TaxID=163603 RepID=A0A846Z470_9ACTN|nr:glycoside hydrolase family 15 protein [Actinomadura latina]NKZ07051.1 glycoside hydrolase family 15 protein [Actinomadura latina]
MSYKDIEDYGLIGDLHTVAMVARDGSIDYLCLPDFDSPTIFAALLDAEEGGAFQIGPAGEKGRLRQIYLPDTNVLLTRFLSDGGVAEITDFMPVGEMRHTHTVVRRVTGVSGRLRFRLRCAPRFGYARIPHKAFSSDREVRFEPEGGGGKVLRLRTPVPLRVEDGDAVGEFELARGDRLDFVLEMIGPDTASVTGRQGWVDHAFRHTVEFWRDWVDHGAYQGRWREMVTRSALALKLLTSEGYGSIAAAATFGLPELVGGERNWDYRYCWIRDASLTAAMLLRLGFTDEPRRFIDWVTQRYRESSGDGRLQIMYGIDGRHDLSEETLPNLSGYRGSTPVRVGNGAYDQLQLDIYGEFLYLVDLYDQRVQHVSHELWEHLRKSVDWVAANWAEPDEGIWEVRGGRQQFLFGRLMCWVALDRAIAVAERRSLPAPIDRWREVRDRIHASMHEEFWDEQLGTFVQHRGSTIVDAAVLLMPITGFISAHDPRWMSTLRAVDDRLADDALVYRYRTGDGASDGLTGTEGTFCMCSFWYIDSLTRSGDLERARLSFEKVHSYANHLGLFAEEMDSAGRYLGNFPQAFSHLGLVGAALSLDEALSSAPRKQLIVPVPG